MTDEQFSALMTAVRAIAAEEARTQGSLWPNRQPPDPDAAADQALELFRRDRDRVGEELEALEARVSDLERGGKQ